MMLAEQKDEGVAEEAEEAGLWDLETPMMQDCQLQL